MLHARCRFLLRTALDRPDQTPWRSSPSLAGSGVVGDLASHHIDLVRWLVGEPAGELLHAVALGCPPEAATFEDGYRCAVICEAALTAAATGRVQPVLDRDDARDAVPRS